MIKLSLIVLEKQKKLDFTYFQFYVVMMNKSLQQLNNKIIHCKKCPRLTKYICNIAKNKWSKEEFLEKCRLVTENNRK